jgi:hypothetical protein
MTNLNFGLNLLKDFCCFIYMALEELITSTNYREAINLALRLRYSTDPEYKERRQKQRREWDNKRKTDPEYRAEVNRKNSEAIKKRYYEDTEYRKACNSKRAEAIKKKYQEDPEYRERMKQKNRERYARKKCET